MRLQPPLHTATASIAYGCSLHCIRLQVNPGTRLGLVGIFTAGAPFNVTLLDQYGVPGDYTVDPSLEVLPQTPTRPLASARELMYLARLTARAHARTRARTHVRTDVRTHYVYTYRGYA